MSLLAFPSRLRRALSTNRPLAPLTTFRIGGPAELYFEPRCLRDVDDALRAAADCGLGVSVIGGGSNLLVDDRGVRGLVLNLRAMRGLRVFGRKVLVQAGANLHATVLACARAGIAGPEGLAGIPGSVGGALAMNAGGRFAEIFDFVERVMWISPVGRLEYRYREELAFGYRWSELREGVVLEAVLEGRAGNPAELTARAGSIMAEKKAGQPYTARSAGCAFMNPTGASAGRLIDQAGCKGLRVGGAQVSDLHANFIVNLGFATADDVSELMARVRRRVFEAHGVELQPEIRVWPGACAHQAEPRA
jgi:UDP-N-acetylmuramate dehydrogenase